MSEQRRASTTTVGRRFGRFAAALVVVVAVSASTVSVGAQDHAGPGEPPAATPSEEPRVRYDDGPLVVGATPFAAEGRTWTRTDLTYGFTNTTPDLGETATRSAIAQALSLWAAVSGMQFTEVADCGLPPDDAACAVPDIRVLFASGDHDGIDGIPPFNGPVLAHAFFPPPNGTTVAGDAHFDEEEDWFNGFDSNGFDLVTVAAHEFGHSLGLAHAPDDQCPNPSGDYALMCPFYNGSRPFLGVDDVAAIQALYPDSIPSPSNDDFAAAQAIGGQAGSTAGSTAGAGREVGEPDHGAAAGSASVWFTWTTPATGTATVDTVGSTFDTLLGVYTGATVDALTALAVDDDSVGQQSRVSFPVARGATYWIAVDGAGGVGGPLLLNWSTACPPPALVDVPPWVQDAICWIMAEGYATGYPADNTFRPNVSITRAQVARMLYRIAGQPPPGPLPPAGCGGLVDVPTWARDGICWLVNQGYATGYPSDSTFRPNLPITRAQVARMLYRIAGQPPPGPLPPAGCGGLVDVPTWARDGICWLVNQGYATGYPSDSTFRPNRNITRAQVTRMLFRIYG